MRGYLGLTALTWDNDGLVGPRKLTTDVLQVKTKETSLLVKDKGSNSDPESTEINSLPSSRTLRNTGSHKEDAA